jgi:PAS domain S-box-containing protein
MIHSGTYDLTLVTVSILISIVASYTALNLVARMRAASGWARRTWLGAAAVAMGGGIWSMHFVAMLAFSMPGMEIGYDLPLTLTSLALPILVTAFGFSVASTRSSFPALAISGTVVGLGIAAMHYTGMAAMRMSADLHYDRVWVAISIVIAVGAAIMALLLAIRQAGALERLSAAVVMGLAVSGMHYSAMQGATFSDVTLTETAHRYARVGQTNLALLVAIITFLILLLASIAAMFDRRYALRVAQESARLRESEQRFGLLLRGVTDYAIFMVDADGIITNWNAGAQRIKGYGAEEVVGSHFSRFYTEEDVLAGVPSMALATAADKGKFEGEGWRVRKDGSRFWASVVLDAVRDDDGHLLGYAKITRDITERKQAQEALQRTQEVLFQAQKMEAVGQLTGGLAHDFNNLLTGVIGSLDLLQTRINQGRYSEVDRYVNAAQGAARRAAALTHRLLAFSRRQTLDPKSTDLNRLVIGMEELFRRSIGPEIHLEVVTAGGLWQAYLDPAQLESSLLNLCINARDAMPGGGRITIETANKWLDDNAAREHDLPPGQFVSLCVTDTGTGMTPDIIAKAFDPFFTTKPIGQGTGLGLSMVYGFVRQSGGQVRVYSEVGHGTTMCLYFPRHHGAAVTEDVVSDRTTVPRAQLGETVLIVDDEPTVRMLVADVLQELGYTVLEAYDGASGLKILQSGVRLDLVITDVGLPGGLNGRQMADAARETRPDLKILFITGYAENAVVGNGYLAPGMQIMTKPFVVEALASRVKDLMRSS